MGIVKPNKSKLTLFNANPKAFNCHNLFSKGYYGVRKDALNNPAFEEIPEYRQPYWDSVPAEPKIEDMAAVVTADPPQRPFVPNHYTHRRFWNPVQGFIEPNQTKPNNIIIELESPEPYVLSELSVLVQLMKECWQERNRFEIRFESDHRPAGPCIPSFIVYES